MPTVARMTDVGLIASGDLDAPFANTGGPTRSRREYIADVVALAERLPSAGAMLNLSVDRYRFAVGLGAALLRGHTSLLPPNHVAETVARLRERFAGVYALVEGPGDDHGLPSVHHAPAPAPGAGITAIPAIDPGLVAFVVAPGLARERIVAALRDRVDAAFLPRRIVHVDALPREATGKLTRARLGEFAVRQLSGRRR